jgi:hypothetical protein
MSSLRFASELTFSTTTMLRQFCTASTAAAWASPVTASRHSSADPNQLLASSGSPSWYFDSGYRCSHSQSFSFRCSP